MQSRRMKGQLIKYITISTKYGGIYAWLIVVSRLLMGVLPLLEVEIMARFIDEFSLVLSGKGDLLSVYTIVACLIAVIALLWVVEKSAVFFGAKLVYRLREQFKTRLIEKCARMKYSCIEDEKVQDKILRVTKDTEKEIFVGLMEMLSVVALGIRVIGIVIIITTKVWWCGIAVLLMHIPIVVLAIKNGKNAYVADKDFAFYMRKYEYLDTVLTGRDSAMERNVFRYSDYVHGMWKEQFEMASSKYLKAFLKYFFAARGYGMLSVVVSFVMVLFLIRPVISGQMSNGLFIAVVSNILTAVSTMIQQLSQNIRELAKKKSYMEDLQDFLSMEEERDGVLDCPTKGFAGFQTIEFQNVSFQYPGTDVYVLKEVSFRLETGKHYAFVGENAAGKTTITKLLLGLYDNYEGKILINGKELRQYPIAELKGVYAVVYQDFAQYQVSFRDNVAIGALYIEERERELRIKEVMEELGLNKDMEKMNQSFDSVLGKLEERDIELSVGQWQRMAIARAMVSDAPVCILDEPSAALDPITESVVYEKYRHLCGNKTTVFITHRLGAIKLVEHIFVLSKGRLEAQGTYEELMASCNSFKVMYETQRGLYE